MCAGVDGAKGTHRGFSGGHCYPKGAKQRDCDGPWAKATAVERTPAGGGGL